MADRFRALKMRILIYGAKSYRITKLGLEQLEAQRRRWQVVESTLRGIRFVGSDMAFRGAIA